jgi:hypothetical protein
MGFAGTMDVGIVAVGGDAAVPAVVLTCGNCLMPSANGLHTTTLLRLAFRDVAVSR